MDGSWPPASPAVVPTGALNTAPDGGQQPSQNIPPAVGGSWSILPATDRGTPSDTRGVSDPLLTAGRLNTGPTRLPSLPPHSMEPSQLRPLLVCSLCRRRPDVPTTLQCGHSLCARHLSLSTVCPIPRCSPVAESIPNIPSSSTVTYYPPPRNTIRPVAPVESRSDVTITKVLDLLDRVQNQLEQADSAQPPTFEDDSDHSNDEGPSANSAAEVQVTSVSLTRARSLSTGSNGRPRKRPRRLPSSEDPDGDLLSHLRSERVRRRSTRHDQPLLPVIPPASPASRETILANFEKNLLTELTCEICFTLLYEPVTTRCQHTFCSRCLHRSLDHSSNCPLCRQDLPTYIHDHPNNKVILSLRRGLLTKSVLNAFPVMYEERKETIEAEDRDARLDTPIFVCQLSFPGMPTLLHFFEPRYRLMLRRCLESPEPCFGMIMPARPGSTSAQQEYGTMLEIKRVEMLNDGRSLVETWGTYRFRILERGTLDGYMVGRIERIEDEPDDLVDDVDRTEPGPTTVPEGRVAPFATRRTSTPEVAQNLSNTALMAKCREFLDELERGAAPWIVQRLSNTYGRIPTDVSSFSFWVASVLPIEEQEKAKLLPIRSARLRLLLVAHWIEQLNNTWYKSFSVLRWVKIGILLIGLFVLFLPGMRATGG